MASTAVVWPFAWTKVTVDMGAGERRGAKYRKKKVFWRYFMMILPDEAICMILLTCFLQKRKILLVSQTVLFSEKIMKGWYLWKGISDEERRLNNFFIATNVWGGLWFFLVILAGAFLLRK